MFGLFLIGWGLSFIWGPISDKFSRTKAIAATVLVYVVFTGAAAFAPNVRMLAIFRFLAGIGVGGEWAMAGTYVAEAWPEDRRKMGAGYFHTGYYFGFFVAAGLNYTIGAAFGWRAMFLVRAVPRRRVDRDLARRKGAGALGAQASGGAGRPSTIAWRSSGVIARLICSTGRVERRR
jgi:MFS family permease